MNWKLQENKKEEFFVSKKGIRILIAILIIVIIGAGALLAYKIMKNKNIGSDQISSVPAGNHFSIII